MSDGRPLLWRVFDAAEKAVAPRLEEATRSSTFAEMLGLAARTQAGVRRGVEARSRRLWHLVNLPAGSDVAHLRRQVALLDRELRRVSTTLERSLAEQEPSEETDDAQHPRRSGNGSPSRPGRAARPSPAGRRAKRPPRA
jgi:hypothetical protein